MEFKTTKMEFVIITKMPYKDNKHFTIQTFLIVCKTLQKSQNHQFCTESDQQGKVFMRIEIQDRSDNKKC